MASTRTPGITIDTDGRRFLDKRYHGVRIGMRVGSVTQEQAEQRLQTEIQRIDLELAERARPRPLLRDCAARYLAQSRDKHSLEAIQVHVRLLIRHIGTLEPQHVHDATLAMRYPAELYSSSPRRYRGLGDLHYPFHDRTITVTQCGRLCMNRRKINLSLVFAGQNVGVKQIDERIWLVSFMHYDLGFFDDETCRLEPADNPFQAKVLPMSPV